MLKRIAKYTALSLLLIVTLLVGLLTFTVIFPPTHEATTILPGTNSTVTIQIEPMHLYLAEYHRKLVLQKSGESDARVDMFPDTGGYLRTQLYRLPDGRFLIRGYFDAVAIDTEKHAITKLPETPKTFGRYLGAFDDNSNNEWTFIPSDKSPEQSLEAEG